MIGAQPEAIDKAEDRALFREAMEKIVSINAEVDAGQCHRHQRMPTARRMRPPAPSCAPSCPRRARQGARRAENQWNLGETDRKQRYIQPRNGGRRAGDRCVGLPRHHRPSFTLGGTGGGIAYNRSEFYDIVSGGLDASPTTEKSRSKKRSRLEGIRDGSVSATRRTIASTLLDRKHRPDGRTTRRLDHRRPGPDAERQRIPDHAQRLDRGFCARSASRPAAPTCSSPSTRKTAARRHEMNPRVSRARPLLHRSHRFPDRQIVRHARRRLHAGRTRKRHHRRRNAGHVRIVIDYVVTKIPRFAFEKFPARIAGLTTALIVGEVWRSAAPSRNRCRRPCAGSLKPALTGLDEIEIPGLVDGDDDKNAIRAAIGTPTPNPTAARCPGTAPRHSEEEVHQGCKIDPWDSSPSSRRSST